LTQFQFLSSNGVYSVAKYATVRTQGKDLLGMQTGIEIPLNPGNINLEREKERDTTEGDSQMESWTVGGKRQKSNYNFNMRCVLNVCWCQFWLSMCNMQHST